jgi:hypothetical protein
VQAPSGARGFIPFGSADCALDFPASPVAAASSNYSASRWGDDAAHCAQLRFDAFEDLRGDQVWRER